MSISTLLVFFGICCQRIESKSWLSLIEDIHHQRKPDFTPNVTYALHLRLDELEGREDSLRVVPVVI